MRKIVPALVAVSLLSGCVGTFDPIERGAQGAAMTIWAGPVAAVGCAMGAMAGAGMGSMMGVATTPPPPSYPVYPINPTHPEMR